MLKKILLLCFLFIVSSNNLFCQNLRIVNIQGFILNLYDNETYKEIRRADSLYGYVLISKNLIFIASQPEHESEASADLEVYDIRREISQGLTFIGGSGESNFDINPITKEIVFNDGDGIKILTIDTTDISYKIELIMERVDGYGVFWINHDSVGFMDYNNYGGKKFIKIKASDLRYYDKLKFLDLENQSNADLKLLRNEIFARHGHSFESEELRKYFNRQPWYKEIPGKKVKKDELSIKEIDLIDKIIKLEQN